MLPIGFYSFVAVLMAVFLSNCYAYTVNTTHDFHCPGLKKVQFDGFRDSTGYYGQTPVYIGPQISCNIGSNSSLVFSMAATSLGLGVSTVLALNSWTMFYGMDDGVLLQLDSLDAVNISGPLVAVDLPFPPLRVMFRNTGPKNASIVLPAIFVSVKLLDGQDTTSSIVGTTVLTLIFLGVLFGLRHVF